MAVYIQILKVTVHEIKKTSLISAIKTNTFLTQPSFGSDLVPVICLSSANQQHQCHACSRPRRERPQRVCAGFGDGFCQPTRELPHQFCPALKRLRWALCFLTERDIEMPREGKGVEEWKH